MQNFLYICKLIHAKSEQKQCKQILKLLTGICIQSSIQIIEYIMKGTTKCNRWNLCCPYTKSPSYIHVSHRCIPLPQYVIFRQLYISMKCLLNIVNKPYFTYIQGRQLNKWNCQNNGSFLISYIPKKFWPDTVHYIYICIEDIYFF